MCFGPRVCVIVHTNRWMCVRQHWREQDSRRDALAALGNHPLEKGRRGTEVNDDSSLSHLSPPRAHLQRTLCLKRRFPAARDGAFPTMSCSRACHSAAQKQAPTARTHISDRPTVHPRSSTGTFGISATRATPRIYNDPIMTHVYKYTKQSLPSYAMGPSYDG